MFHSIFVKCFELFWLLRSKQNRDWPRGTIRYNTRKIEFHSRRFNNKWPNHSFNSYYHFDYQRPFIRITFPYCFCFFGEWWGFPLLNVYWSFMFCRFCFRQNSAIFFLISILIIFLPLCTAQHRAYTA